jgi:hypothetical protein
MVISPSVGNELLTFNAKKLWRSKVALPKIFCPELERVLASKDAKLFTGKLRKSFGSRIVRAPRISYIIF